MRRLFSLIWSCLAAACGLISEDVADFKLRLPEKPFTVDSAAWGLLLTAPTVPEVPCSANCSDVALAWCREGACSSDCDGDRCQAHVALSMRQMFSLAMEAPELMALDEKAVITVSVDGISFRIDESSFGTATPPLAIYLAPIDVVAPPDTRAQLVGNIEAVPPGTDVPVVREVVLAADGRTVVKKFMEDFRTPFNVILTGQVDFHGGDPTPSGRLTGVMVVKAHAGL